MLVNLESTCYYAIFNSLVDVGHVSMGALGDSFYEYLLKSYLQTGDVDARQMYDDAIEAFEKNGLIRYSKSGLLYFAEMRYDRLESKMDHLACFAGGMLALGAIHDPTSSLTQTTENNRASRHMKIAEGITNTCHESYIRTATRLGKITIYCDLFLPLSILHLLKIMFSKCTVTYRTGKFQI